MCQSHGTAAARAAIALAATRPWRLVELGLVDLPDACVAPQERERHRPADLQQFSRLGDFAIANSTPSARSSVRLRTNRPMLRPTFLALSVALFCADMRELCTEQYYLRRVIDPDQDDDDRCGRAIR